MTSVSLKKFNVRFRFNKSNLSRIPDEWGVYVLSLNKKIGRLKGASDILYIGKSTYGLRSRLSFYFNPGKTQYTSKRIYAFIKRHKNLQISFKATDNPRILEKRLIQRYFKEHEELPPLNRAK